MAGTHGLRPIPPTDPARRASLTLLGEIQVIQLNCRTSSSISTGLVRKRTPLLRKRARRRRLEGRRSRIRTPRRRW